MTEFRDKKTGEKLKPVGFNAWQIIDDEEKKKKPGLGATGEGCLVGILSIPALILVSAVVLTVIGLVIIVIYISVNGRGFEDWAEDHGWSAAAIVACLYASAIILAFIKGFGKE